MLVLSYLPLGCILFASFASALSAGPALSLWYKKPAEKWVEALPLGNGRLGAMVFGGIENERLQLNDETLWGGSPYDPTRAGAREAIAQARQLVFAGKGSEATKLIN